MTAAKQCTCHMDGSYMFSCSTHGERNTLVDDATDHLRAMPIKQLRAFVKGEWVPPEHVETMRAEVDRWRAEAEAAEFKTARWMIAADSARASSVTWMRRYHEAKECVSVLEAELRQEREK